MGNKVIFKTLSGPDTGAKFAAEEPIVCIIGRADDCTITISKTDNRVSRHHCLIDINPPLLTIEDLGSSNGTLLNNENLSGKADPTLLRDEDIIQVGDTQIKVEVQGFEPDYRKSSLNGTFEENNDTETAETLEDPAEKQIISGYRIIKRLGQGSGGAVYLAEMIEEQRQVALKTMLPEIAVDVEHKARFIRETKSMSDLSHPNIVSIIDSGYSKGVFYFSLEYCNSGNLEDLMRQNRDGLPVKEALSIINKVLDGLEYLHYVMIQDIELDDGSIGTATGLVHRDIKPENILMHKNGNEQQIKIADFGLAKAFNLGGLRGLTQTGAVGGTLAFVCRQQILNYKYAKPEVDIWSAVALLYYLLTGYPPRDLERVKNPLCSILETDPVPLQARKPKLPKELIEIVNSALNDKKELKFKSAKEFKEALKSVKF